MNKNNRLPFRMALALTLLAIGIAVLAAALLGSSGKEAIPGWTPVNDALRTALEQARLPGGQDDSAAPGSQPERKTAPLSEPQPDQPPGPASDRQSPDPAAGPGQSPASPEPAGSPAEFSPEDPAPPAAPSGTEAGTLDLNRATEADLDALPGIGPAKAKAILAHRDKIGGFRRVEQLLDVKGIGPKVFERLSVLVHVGARE
ncbi:ComEA family DNA-binding protein [Cohnella hongkongensis]|uniref:Helix-hairpin-helix domain-containing protein n=1 Tax=Cohnella hongkongensis TaxID=178337 RepID=A0ABV9FCD3_9BACL